MGGLHPHWGTREIVGPTIDVEFPSKRSNVLSILTKGQQPWPPHSDVTFGVNSWQSPTPIDKTLRPIAFSNWEK